MRALQRLLELAFGDSWLLSLAAYGRRRCVDAAINCSASTDRRAIARHNSLLYGMSLTIVPKICNRHATSVSPGAPGATVFYGACA